MSRSVFADQLMKDELLAVLAKAEVRVKVVCCSEINGRMWTDVCVHGLSEPFACYSRSIRYGDRRFTRARYGKDLAQIAVHHAFRDARLRMVLSAVGLGNL